jgi:(R,R)-butanediol dehydrogenase/meso-butanediol dehydrogenase/diacetyl reductase
LAVVQADEVFRLPASVTGIEQALVEPLAIARRAVNRAGLVPTDRVAILGGGPIGLAIAAWARHLGVEQVTVTDPEPTRRALAERLGATRAIDPVGDELAMLELALAGCSVVFECVGRPGMIRQAMELVGVDGRVVVVGVCIHEDTFFPYTGLHKELDVRYSIYYERRDFLDTIAVLDRGGLNLDGFVEGTVDLEGLPERFAALLAGAVGGKVVLTP